jgi:geranylgeranyl pyrophosphate synthase
VPTCHRAFDEATAILAGDALQALAFELLAQAASVPAGVRVQLVATLASASGGAGMVGGQAIDLDCVAREVPRATLEHMHALKTGALIRAAVRMGGLLAEADAATLARLDAYATALGLGFQVQDDVLDACGSAQALGKQPGVDAARAKPTFVSLLGLAQAQALAAGLGEAAVAALEPFGARASSLAELARFAVQRDR